MAETAAGSRDENGSSGQLQLQRTDCAGDSQVVVQAPGESTVKAVAGSGSESGGICKVKKSLLRAQRIHSPHHR